MNIGLAFWIVYLIWIVFGAWAAWPLSAANSRIAGGTLLLLILLGLLGWGVFGAPLHR